MRLKVHGGLSLSGGEVGAEATGAPASSSPATMHSAMRIMQSFLVWSSIDDRSWTCMYGMLRRKECRRHPCIPAAKSARGAPFFFPRQDAYSFGFQRVAA